MKRSRVTDHEGYVAAPGGTGSRARHPTLRLQRPPESETDDRALRNDAYETVERPVRGDTDYLVPVTGGQRVYAIPTGEQDVYAAPGHGDSAIVTNPTFRGGDQPQQPGRMIKQKLASDRWWRMLNMFVSVVAIAIAVVALMRKPDAPAAAE